MKKIITLEQVEATGYTDVKADGVEEGDKIGDFRVVGIQEVDCDHPKARWSMSGKITEGDPVVKATCQVCGESGSLDIPKGDIL